MKLKSVVRTAACAIAAACTHCATAADPVRLPHVEVIGATPVPGTDVPREHVPANVQVLEGATLRRSHALSLPEALSTHLPSVNVNEVQGNPYQMDVNYRGFTASPLLGTPQGLSIYQDGVRLNEPFGDIVNWDLIPMLAVESLTLAPGSNPLFGLNTLGGALVLQTKSGLTSSGTEALVSGGSFGRRRLELSHGAKLGGLHGFIALSGFEEDGWRDHSPSRLRNAFGKLGQSIGPIEWDLALTHGKSSLIGNGLLPTPMLAARREQIYTRPDSTKNEMTMVTLNGAWWLSDDQRLSLIVYQRENRTRTVNGDVNDDFEDADDPNGVENRTHTRQRGRGATLQWSRLVGAHHTAAGASFDRGKSRFRQTEAEGILDETRAVVPTEEEELDSQLRGMTRTASVYLTHTHALSPNLHLTLSARYNVTRVQTTDELSGSATPNLDGDFTYRKLNPAIGATWQPTTAMTLYGGFSQGSRAPSPIELGCADPAQPCTLPNALQSDPFLKQVVARTLEIGARGQLPQSTKWNVGLFHTRSTDDILFVGTTASASRGFFQNFGRTRRQGVELGLSGRNAPFEWQASYSLVRATFESTACVVSLSNSTAGTSAACAPEQIEVRPGDRIPGIPLHNFKLNVITRPAARWTLNTTLTAHSGQYVRGNENNAHRPDGAFSGSGKIGGYALVDLLASYDLGSRWQLFAKIANVFDRDYASAGQLGRSSFDAQGRFVADSALWTNELFVGPGAPRTGWVGLRYQLARK
jgi:outer membrane receptor protein involved in Fe transport